MNSILIFDDRGNVYGPFRTKATTDEQALRTMERRVRQDLNDDPYYYSWQWVETELNGGTDE